MTVEFEEYKKRLEEKLKELRGQFSSVSAQDPYRRQGYSDENTQDDDAAEREDHARVEAIEEAIKAQVESVEGALARVEKGSYGICQSCKNKIDKARLELLPEAEYCISCQKKQAQKAY